MNHHRINFTTRTLPFALACSLIAAVGTAQAETVDTINKKFPATAGGRLVVNVDVGGVNVRGGDANEVAIEVVRKVRAGDKADEEEFLRKHTVTIEQDGATVTVRSRKEDSGGSWWNRVRTNTDFRYTITVPRKFNTELKTSGGGITVNDVDGDNQSNTSGGGLRFEQVKGKINGHTSGGGITLAGCAAEVDVHTSGGGIESRDGTGTYDLDTSGGNISLSSHRGDVTAHTSGGGITTSQINGRLDAKTSGGSIQATLMAAPGGECRLSSSGGSVTVNLPASVALTVDASTSAGSVKTDFEFAGADSKKSSRLKGDINGGGPLLHLRSSAGSIRLNRLPGGPEKS